MTMSMKLHQIHGKNRYCGPAAISAITGASTDDAAYAIRCRSGQRFVKGSEDRHVLEALLESGVFAERAYSAPTGKGLTFAQWRRHSKGDRKAGVVFLVIAGNHYQVVSGRRATCGRLREIVSIADKRLKQRARVCAVWKLIAPSKITPPVQPKRSKDRYASARAKARQLASKHGCEIDIDRNYYGGFTHYWVYGPDHVEADKDYPYEGDHIVHDWDEVVERIEDIAKFEASMAKPLKV